MIQHDIKKILTISIIFLIVSILSAGCTSNNSSAFSTNPGSIASGFEGGANNGDTIEISYVGTLDSGEIFESSEKNGENYKFILGNDTVFPAFEQALIGMKIGEIRSINLTPDEAYGDFNSSKILEFPLSALGGQNVHVGKIVTLVSHTGGDNLTAKIVKMDEQNVTLNYDENVLVGQNLHYQVHMVNIIPGKLNPSP
jgi:FKBP-type peptidyl-prolyl cis-trans isomerase 2